MAEGLAPGLLSVRAPADDDVWMVGANHPDGSGPAALRFDGTAWTRIDTSDHATQELWWVHVFDDDVVMVGSEGLILEGDRATATLSEATPPSDEATLFGVWGASADDVWTVGESTAEGGGPVLWRRQSGAWSAYDLSGIEGLAEETLFKVDGTAADDAWIVGTGGTSLRWDGTAWTKVATDADVATGTSLLLTVDAQGARPWTVGGAGNALILGWDGEAWRDESPAFVPALNGICTQGEHAWAVGVNGARVERVDGAWVADADREIRPATFRDWHGCDISPGGDVWMVGGALSSRPLTDGVVGYLGPLDPEAPPL